jgi:hypothetical protein
MNKIQRIPEIVNISCLLTLSMLSERCFPKQLTFRAALLWVYMNSQTSTFMSDIFIEELIIKFNLSLLFLFNHI